MAMLTIIIPFLNEGIEVYNTVKSIRDTANIDLNIILINDASTDGYDYKSVAIEFDVQYIVHSERKGVAASRDEGVNMCQTKYFILLDAHMRFYQTNWTKIIIEELNKDNRALFCCKTIHLSKNNNKIIRKNNPLTSFGAYFHNSENRSYISQWNFFDSNPNETIVDIACVLGAAYSMSKEYWLYLKGLEGLRSYGRDEELISLKVWLEGGRCRLIKDVAVGHIYRESMPYEYLHVDMIYNLLYIAELLYDEENKQNTYKKLKNANPTIFSQALKLIDNNMNEIKDRRDYFKSIFNRNIKSIIRHNNLLQDINMLYRNPLSRFTVQKNF